MIELIAKIQEHSRRMRGINERIIAMQADSIETNRKLSGMLEHGYQPHNILDMHERSIRLSDRSNETADLMERMQSLFSGGHLAESFSLMPRVEEMVDACESLHRQAVLDIRRAWDSCIARN